MTAAIPNVTGRIDFFRPDGSNWGCEHIAVNRHAKGWSYRSYMDMRDHATIRDANWSMSPDHKPLEGFARETVNGETTAHGWYRIDGATAEYEAWTVHDGRVSQKVEAPHAIDHLGLHVLMTDCMVSAARGLTDVGVEKRATCLANSLDGYGRGVSQLLIVEPLVAYLGTESLTVPAGTFDAEHFVVRWSDNVPTPSHFWVLRDYFLPLRLEGATDPVAYELAEIRFD